MQRFSEGKLSNRIHFKCYCHFYKKKLLRTTATTTTEKERAFSICFYDVTPSEKVFGNGLSKASLSFF